MLKSGQPYADKGAEYYEQRNRQQQIEFVRTKAAQLGLAGNSSPCLKLSSKKLLQEGIYRKRTSRPECLSI
jgi:hypothetical protein